MWEISLVENIPFFYLIYPYALIAFCDSLPRWKSDISCTIHTPLFCHWKSVTGLGEDAWLCSLCYPGTPCMEVTQVLHSSHGSVQEVQWGFWALCAGNRSWRTEKDDYAVDAWSVLARALEAEVPPYTKMCLPEDSNQTLINSPSLFSLFGSSFVVQKWRKSVMSLSSAGNSC